VTITPGVLHLAAAPVEGDGRKAAPWRKAMRRDIARWAVRARRGRQPHLPREVTPARSETSNAARAHRIPPRVRDDREPPLLVGRDE
jgi:hypothetical protein